MKEYLKILLIILITDSLITNFCESKKNSYFGKMKNWKKKAPQSSITNLIIMT